MTCSPATCRTRWCACRAGCCNADDLPRLLQLDSGCVAVRCCLVERDERHLLRRGAGAGRRGPDAQPLLEALGARSVTAARAEQVNAATDYAAGLVCPVGLPADVEVLADTALQREPTSYCALGEGGVALGIRTADLLGRHRARLVPLSRRSARAHDRARPPARPAPAPSRAGSDLRGRAGSSDVL